MTEVTTKTGFKIKIDPRMANDWRVFTAIAEAEGDNAKDRVKATTELVELILGKDQDRMMKHISELNDGYIPVSAVTAEIADIIAGAKELKN